MTGRRKSKSHLFCMLAPLLFCLVYLLFCAINISGSVWFDESFSAYLIRGNFTDILSLTAADVHPPFFYFCLKKTGNQVEAEDLTQDIALQIISSLNKGTIPTKAREPKVMHQNPRLSTLFLSLSLSITKRKTPSAIPTEIMGKSRLAVWVIRSAVE